MRHFVELLFGDFARKVSLYRMKHNA